MTLRLLASAVFALLVTGAACTEQPPEPDNTAQGQCGQRSPCVQNFDCSAGSICDVQADAASGCCLQILCTADFDCSEKEECDERRGLCVPEDLCDPSFPEGKCAPGKSCIYQAGLPRCVDASELPAPDGCAIEPTVVRIPAGSSTRVAASAFMNSGALVPRPPFTFTTDIGSVDQNGQLVGACEGSDVCNGTLTAHAGTASCTAAVTVYPTVSEGQFRAVVLDRDTRAPLAGTRVALRIAGTDAMREVAVDADGVALFADIAGPIAAVSAFPTGHDWTTLVEPGSNDVVIFASAVKDQASTAGVKGTFDFSKTTTQGDLRLGLAGLAVPTSVMDLDLGSLVGEIASYPLTVEGAPQLPETVPLPSGVVMSLAASDVKPSFVAFNRPGPSVLWGLGGKLRLADLTPILARIGGEGDTNIGGILTSVLPFFSKFDHGIVTGIETQAVARPPEPAVEGSPVPYADWAFYGDNERIGSKALPLDTLLSQTARYAVPTLPCTAGAREGSGCRGMAHQSGAVLVTGTIIPGLGIVPLGLSAGLDDPDDQDGIDQRDGVVTSPNASLGAGELLVDFAPPHDGLEGNLMATIAVAVDIDAIARKEKAASIIVHLADRLSDPLHQFPTGFLEQQGGLYEQAAGTFALNASGAADFYRLALEDEQKRAWNIYFPSHVGELALETLRPTDISGRVEGADVQAFRLGSGYTGAAPQSFAELVQFNGKDFDRIAFFLGAWSNQPCLPASANEAVVDVEPGQPAPEALPPPHCLAR